MRAEGVLFDLLGGRTFRQDGKNSSARALAYCCQGTEKNFSVGGKGFRANEGNETEHGLWGGRNWALGLLRPNFKN